MATVLPSVSGSAPSPPLRHHALSLSAVDVDKLRTMLADFRHAPELPGDPRFAYLDEPIAKPWGRESRVYADALNDVWLLSIEPGRRTSEHAHVRKETILVCLDGTGTLTTGDGTEISIGPGSVVLIPRGALHRSATATGMTLLEFESPRDKADVLRWADDAGRGSGYETAAAARRRRPGSRADTRLRPVAGGPPHARVRTFCGHGTYRFAVEPGGELITDRPGLCVAISLELGAILARRFVVIGAETASAATATHPFLTVRRGPALS